MGLDREKIRQDAIAYISNGDYDKALVEYQKLVVLEAGSPEVHNELAQIYEKLNNHDKASQEYVRAGRIYERAKEIEKALELYEKAFTLDNKRKDLYRTIEDLKNKIADKKKKEEESKGDLNKKSSKKKQREEEGKITIISRDDINIPLFSELDERELYEILSISERKNFKKDEIIVNEGEEGDSIYFIISGEVGVFKKSAGENIWLNTLRDGDFFGEFAYFSNTIRQASVIATQDTEVLIMNREGLDMLSEKYPGILNVLTNFYKLRVLDTVVGLSPVFNILQPQQRQKIISRFELSIVPRGEVIIKEGEAGSGLYFIKNGKVKMITTTPDGRKVEIGFLKEFDFFGEVSLLMGVPTTATVIADTEVRLMKLSRENFRWLIDEFPFLKKHLMKFIEERAENTIGTILRFYEKEGTVTIV